MTPRPQRTIWADGHQAWYVKGERHRTDGPAWIDADGTKEWWVNGKNITAQVETWIQQQGISWPLDPLTQTQFILTFA